MTIDRLSKENKNRISWQRWKSYILTLLLDSSFLAVSLILSWGLAWLLARLPLENSDLWMLEVIKYLFNISTFGFVLGNMFIDFITIVKDVKVALQGFSTISSSNRYTADLQGEYNSEDNSDIDKEDLDNNHLERE